MTDPRIQGTLVHLELPPNTAPCGDASRRAADLAVGPAF
jgi:hypothetical protein